ncbi:MAG: hypothetical protein J0H68_04670 [Sphingobacteriia bacterium]|nr:hypothetical protein [Sphingobacteriia bacterium]
MRFLAIIFLILTSCQTINIKKSQEDHLQNARTMALNHQFKFAVEEYKKAKHQNKFDYETNFEYAKVLRAASEFDEAIKVCKEILASLPIKDSMYAEVAEETAHNYLTKADLENAEKYFNEVITIDGYRWRAISHLGLIAAMEGRYAESDNYFEMALDASNRNYVVLNNYANAKLLANKCKDAKKLLQEALTKKIPKDFRLKIERNLKGLKNCK